MKVIKTGIFALTDSLMFIFRKLGILKNSYTNMIENAVTSHISQSHIYIQIQNNNNKISKPSR